MQCHLNTVKCWQRGSAQAKFRFLAVRESMESNFAIEYFLEYRYIFEISIAYELWGLKR
jgi:hypothetical protein